MKKILALLVLAVLIMSCHQKSNKREVMYELAGVEEEMNSAVRQAPDAAPAPVEKPEMQEVNKKKIIKDGRIGLKVTDLEKTKTRIDTLVRSFGGYYANENFNNTDWESSYNLKIRLPFSNFEKFIAVVESGIGEILYKGIDARDVTDQFIDLETRLETKRNYLQRYNDLLKQAKTIKEILDIEEKIRVLEEEIDSTTGRLKYLSDLVDYSTLDLTISKRKDFRYNPVDRDKFSERLKQSLSKGWLGFVDFILFLIKVWPFWIIVILLIFFWKKYKKTRKKS
ncbi:MAG: DUF4349 domain-containing protein [Bacteroidales bacterium]|jgi:hypothetical protein|nr:DUF4349 domain-containing protein [Bacteroidales bacterium]